MKRKGFTLIELLAVIVILAIIALIATPTILNVIEKARRGSAEQSALGYIDAVEKQVAINQVKCENFINDGVYEVSNLKDLGVTIKGEMPNDDSWVKVEKSLVTDYSLKFESYTVTYNNETKEKTIEKNGAIAPKPEGEVTYQTYQNGTAIYYNPVTNEKCEDYIESNSTTGTKIGCMKWYTFNDEGETSSTVNMILDHNTTSTVAWNSTGSNSEMKEVATALSNDTKDWNSSIKPRIIRADEVSKITNNTNFDVAASTYKQWFYLDSNSQMQTASSQGTSKYSWLYDYTNNCTMYGCRISDSKTYGYWTSTSTFGGVSHAWRIFNQGNLNVGNITDSGSNGYAGLRPVITIQKSIIQ